MGELSKVCFQIVLTCLHLARIGRPDISWSVNKLARAITNSTKSSDKRLARLISYIHHTNEYRQCCYATQNNNADWGLFQDLILQETLKMPGSFIARKALRWTRIILWMDQRSKTTSHWKRYSDTVQQGELRSDRNSKLVNEFFIQFSSFHHNDTFKAGDWSSCISLKFVHLTDHDCVKRQRKTWESRKRKYEWDWFPPSACVKFTCWTERKNGESGIDSCWPSKPKMTRSRHQEEFCAPLKVTRSCQYFRFTSFTQFYRSWNQFCRRRFTHGRYSRSRNHDGSGRPDVAQTNQKSQTK